MEWRIWVPDRAYFILNNKDHFKYIFKKHGKKAFNPSIRKYINKIENRIAFKIESGYYLKRLSPKTMKLLKNTKSKITKDENGENVPYLEITDVVLMYCNFINNGYQQDSRDLHIFFPDKSFDQLLNILPKK